MEKIPFIVAAIFLLISFSQFVEGNTECSRYTFLTESNRAKTYYNSTIKICDKGLRGWYRFGGEAGNQMADSCVNRRHCGAGMPGWLVGSHPSVADGTVRRQVCFQYVNDCCRRSTETDVRNCGSFYVYYLTEPPFCNARYCGNGLESRLECSSYKFLNESNRAKTYKTMGSPLSDNTLVSGWYRFGGEAGNQMTESCVNTGHCGTDEPGWLNGSHLSVPDGVVKRKVCFYWPENCCRRSIYIHVRNCAGFYVYKLRPLASEYNLRYCGNGLPPAPGGVHE